MRKLSTNIFYYYRVFVAAICPIVIITSIIEVANGRNLPIFVVLLCLVLILFLTQWVWILKYRQVSYNDSTLYIKSYFAYNSIDIPIENVISLVRKSDFYRLNVLVGYKMVFLNDGKKEKIYFYRALELANIHDLESYLKRQKSGNIYIPNTSLSREETISIQKRLGSAILDQFIMTIVVMIFGLPSIIQEFSQNVAHKLDNKFHFTPVFGIELIGFALFFCKDCLYGQSFAKKELKLQVINNKTGQIANPLRCLVRDIFMIVWPIEVIFLLVNPARRLGDFVAGTKLIPYDAELERPALNYFQLAFAFLISYCIWIGVTIMTGSF